MTTEPAFARGWVRHWGFWSPWCSIFSPSGPFVCFSSRLLSSLLRVRSYSSALHTQVSLVHCILDFLTMTFFCNIIYSPSSLRWWEQAVIYVPTALLKLMAKSISTIVPFLLWVAFMLSFIPFNRSFIFHPHILCLLLAACSPCTWPCGDKLCVLLRCGMKTSVLLLRGAHASTMEENIPREKLWLRTATPGEPLGVFSL